MDTTSQLTTKSHRRIVDKIYRNWVSGRRTLVLLPDDPSLEHHREVNLRSNVLEDEDFLFLLRNDYLWVYSPFPNMITHRNVVLTPKGEDLVSDHLFVNGLHTRRETLKYRKENKRRWVNMSGGYGASRTIKQMCPSCFTINRPCDCNVEAITISANARPPRAQANKRQWYQFLTLFAPDVLKRNDWWTVRQKILKER